MSGAGRKRHSAMDIARKLRRADELTAEGKTGEEIAVVGVQGSWAGPLHPLTPRHRSAGLAAFVRSATGAGVASGGVALRQPP
ncbi:hypothetical protein BTO20_37125 (plasmid) [Mycobacterium dioxanotrophicus]|uniref:Uncharacterized protein n=1 Tax=Mycobacterium dioxanotrophicus TaxID=482462 RepID=A0A1Y0CGY0_9MYCO|nr:hypothetical protein BTO20_37125 [Mycobacterium dioxanotrophicus]